MAPGGSVLLRKPTLHTPHSILSLNGPEIVIDFLHLSFLFNLDSIPLSSKNVHSYAPKRTQGAFHHREQAGGRLTAPQSVGPDSPSPSLQWVQHMLSRCRPLPHLSAFLPSPGLRFHISIPCPKSPGYAEW